MIAARREILAAAAALAGAATAWLAFRWLPPSHVLVGTTAVDAWVPPHYQATAFAPFCGFAAVLALDFARSRATSGWPSRVALVLATSLVAVVRLAGLAPLSGHAVLAAAVVVHEARSPHRSAAVAAAAVASAAITGWYKLFVWGDVAWFALSCAVGVAIGLACTGGARR